MRICNTITVILVACLTCSTALHAQYQFDKAVLIGKENGLPSTSIRSVTKDEAGFIWMGTSEGLCRFDGLEIKLFQEGDDPRTSLFENEITSVLAVKNHIWVATGQGISVLNTKDYTFRHYQFINNGKTDSLERRADQQVNALYLDRRGKIWVGTADRGVAVYDEVKDHFRFFSPEEEKFPPLVPALGASNSVLSIIESVTDDSVIWAGTEGGLQKINRVTGHTELFTFPQTSKDYQIALNAFRRLYHHSDGMLYVGSWAAGVNVFDPVHHTFTPLHVKNDAGKSLVKSVIGNIIQKKEHEIWISALTGLAVYDTKLKDITWYKLNKPEEKEIYGISYIDESNRVWNSTIYGMMYFDALVQQFSNFSFKHLSRPDWAFAFYILPDKSGNYITVCPRITDGMFVFDKIKKEWSKIYFPRQENFMAERAAVRGFIQFSDGEYVISADNGIYRYSRNKNKLWPVNHGPPFSPTRRGDLFLARNGQVWMSDDTWGLTRWDPRSGNFINYKKQTLPGDTTGTFNRLINLFEDSHGNIWYQRAGGIGVYVTADDRFHNFIYTKNKSNSFSTANAFAEDKKGRVWISSDDGELGYALSNDPSKGLVYKLTEGHRTRIMNFRRMTTDPYGNVWGYNQKELVKINAEDLGFTAYSFQYGVSNPDFYHFSFLPSGEIIFGGRNDITLADPAGFKRNNEVPSPYISEIQVLNQPYQFSMNGQPLKLRHRQNFFSIGFSAKAYTMPKDVMFRYRLSGFDEWSEPTNRRFANYTNVPGGEYVFQLQAANNEGLWNEDILELPMVIATPFWLTWTFRISLVLAVVLCIYLIYKNRIKQIRKKQKLKSEYEKKLANVEMSALLAQMNPHFLFNSLNSIDSYIIRNESGKASEYLNNFARLMRLILQNSRSNYITLKDELEALDLYLQMENLRFRDKFSYAIKVGNEVDQLNVSLPPMLIQPYVENAIWHGLMHKTNGEPGKVELEVSQSGDNLHCIIQDNGIGRKKAGELKAQKQSNHKRSMGMQITHDRIEIINKLYNINARVTISDIEKENGEPGGTRVELVIPV